MRTSLPAAIVAALMVLTGCATESPQAAPTVDTPKTTPSQPMRPTATAPLADIDYAEYLEAAVDLMEARYFDRANVDLGCDQGCYDGCSDRRASVSGRGAAETEHRLPDAR